MVMIYKATPRAVLKGIKDETTRQLPAETSELPQHLPAFFLQTQESEEINIVGGDAATAIYGAETFNQQSDFYNHQTVGANIALKNANQIMVIPIKMEGAKKASVRLGVE